MDNEEPGVKFNGPDEAKLLVLELELVFVKAAKNDENALLDMGLTVPADVGENRLLGVELEFPAILDKDKPLELKPATDEDMKMLETVIVFPAAVVKDKPLEFELAMPAKIDDDMPEPKPVVLAEKEALRVALLLDMSVGVDNGLLGLLLPLLMLEGEFEVFMVLKENDGPGDEGNADKDKLL